MKQVVKSCWIPVLCVAAVAIAMRVPRLDQRPMHTDEAVHAEKFAQLLELNFYHYDPFEYHGPTLNYFTLIPAFLKGEKNFTQINESTLRSVTVFFGVLTVLLMILLCDGLSPPVTVCAALFTAVSPAMVYYSRYYIQEMLLVCFTLGTIACGYRFMRDRSIIFAILTGLFLGLVHATKETCIITFASIVLALVITRMLRRWDDKILDHDNKKITPLHFIALIIAAVAVSVVFYSSFFTNPNGVTASIGTYTNYLHRAGANPLHIHPWQYYLKLLFWSDYPESLHLNEAFLLILAIIGAICIIARKGLKNADYNLLKFILFYTLIMTAVYSMIPYKTPWSMLSFLHGIIIMAAAGAVAILNLMPGKFSRVTMSLVMIACLIHLTSQATASSYKYCADPTNPYVYAHTSNDIFKVVERIEKVAATHPLGKDMPIQVIFSDDDYWPLPWYLRDFTKISWANKVDFNARPAELIIASPDLSPDIVKFIYDTQPPGRQNLYIPFFQEYIEMRPGVELQGYITNDLWDSFIRKASRKNESK